MEFNTDNKDIVPNSFEEQKEKSKFEIEIWDYISKDKENFTRQNQENSNKIIIFHSLSCTEDEQSLTLSNKIISNQQNQIEIPSDFNKDTILESDIFLSHEQNKTNNYDTNDKSNDFKSTGKTNISTYTDEKK